MKIKYDKNDLTKYEEIEIKKKKNKWKSCS